MIEFGVFQNGGTDLPLHKAGQDGVPLPSGNIADMAASFNRILRDQVTQGVLAEDLGYSYFFMTEHHFQPEGAEFSPNPLLVETAIAAATSKIRLGQSTNILPQWNPLRIAEMGAMLDVISGGRLEFGIGRGYQPREVEVLGAPYGASVQDQERNRAYHEEAFEIILKAWTKDSWSHSGTFFQIPPRYVEWDNPLTKAYFGQEGRGANLRDVLDSTRAADGVPAMLQEISVFPRPVQLPHPQIWMPITSPRSTSYVARHGINGMLTPQRPAAARILVERYMEVAERHGWPDYQGRGKFCYGWDANKRRGLTYQPWVHIVPKGPRYDAAIEKFERGLSLMFAFYGHFGFARSLADPGEQVDLKKTVTGRDVRERGLAFVGTAEEVTEQLCKFIDHVGFEDALLVVHFELAGLTGAEVEEQMRMFAELVIPQLERRYGRGPELQPANWRVPQAGTPIAPPRTRPAAQMA